MILRVILLITLGALLVDIASSFRGAFRENFRKDSSIFDARKDAEREEQFRIQQEMLSRRKNKGAMKNYMEGVEKRREDIWSKAMVTNYARDTKDKDDPLEKFKKNKQAGAVKPLGYEAPPPAKFGSFPIPLNPIGMPKYDNGERFDLRLPYAERGYEDEDADVMKKAGNFFSGLFGGKKDAGDKGKPAGKEPPKKK